MLRRTVPLVAVLALICGSCAGAAQKPKPEIDGARYLTADKLRRGMKGYGLTVFQGTKPEKFNVEVIGVMHNVWDIDSDIILIRCSGHGLEKTGIAGGMSGSPIYVDGKLIGALAYGFSFAKAAIAGVTPIAEMLPLMDRKPEKPAGKAATSFRLKEPIHVFGRDFSTVKFASSPTLLKPDGSGAIEMCPITTPIRLAGLGPPQVARRLLKDLGPELEGFGLMPVQGGTAGAADVKDAKLEPGAVVGVRLLWGDLDWDAVGTVTEVRGKRVLAFGHPMYAEADIDIPMTTGYIYTIMPSFARTFKLGAGGRIVGRIDTDRSKGVAGTIGARGESVRIAVSVSGLEGSKVRKYSLEALRHPRITPAIIGLAVGSCLFQSGEPPEELTVAYRITVAAEGYPPIVIENVESGWDGWGTASIIRQDVRGILSSLTSNKFKRVYPRSVKVDAKFEPVRRYAEIETVALDRSEVRRGETLRATVELKRLKAGRVRKVIDIPIPRDAPLGPATLQVCGSGAYIAAERKDAPSRYDPQDFPQLLELLRKEYRRDRLYVRVSYAAAGIAIRGKELRDLPSSVYGVIASRKQTGLTHVRDAAVTTVPCGLVVSGSQMLKINVEEER